MCLPALHAHRALGEESCESLWELELYMVISCRVGTGMWNSSKGTTVSPVNP